MGTPGVSSCPPPFGTSSRLRRTAFQPETPGEAGRGWSGRPVPTRFNRSPSSLTARFAVAKTGRQGIVYGISPLIVEVHSRIRSFRKLLSSGHDRFTWLSRYFLRDYSALL